MSKAQLTDSRLGVRHIKFAPQHMGLKLACSTVTNRFCVNTLGQATCSEDGVLRVYEAPDALNLSYWQMQVCYLYHSFVFFACCICNSVLLFS